MFETDLQATTKNTSTITRRAATEAMAKVLASSSDNVFVYSKTSKPSLLKELASIAGLVNFNIDNVKIRIYYVQMIHLNMPISG